ncbi:MAG: Hpt domain-containing protein, partial [Pseudanabaena sp.]
MNSEQQQQRIMGYFIEEAREHLQTIEQGVLNLHNILDEPESINELFRAAHSIKGGAAMLGVGSIQHVAHRLEDFFKILKENPQINVDERLKSLLLAGFDPLAELLDELQIGFRISDELTQEISNRVKPVFTELESHINQLTSNSNEQVVSPILVDQKVVQQEQLIVQPKTFTSQRAIFQEEITNKMRDMLQIFRGVDSQESRSQLLEICNYFQEVGNRLELSNWTNLANQIKNLIAYPINSYQILAPIVIRELKDAQDLVLANREAEIATSQQIQTLLSNRFSEEKDDDVSTIFTTTTSFPSEAASIEEDLKIIDDLESGEYEALELDSINPVTQQSHHADEINLFSNQEKQEEVFDLSEIHQEQIDQMSWMDSEYEITENQHIDGPKVGASELKTLATLFENDDIDFDVAWQDIESNEINLA